MNRGEWITDLMSEWRPEGEKKWNPDDFMKFIRWGQWRIEQTGAGILAFITNHTYLDGLTHRRMRESLLRTFTDIYVLDLHGSTRYREKSPTGDEDENVFDIQQGAAISLFVREPGHGGSARVHYAELWGSRLDKYAELSEKDIGGVQWTTLDDVARKTCLGDFFFFAPKAFANVDEYCEGPSIRAIFPVGQNGVKTDRDELFVDLDRDALTDRMRTFYSDAGLDPEFREAFRVRDSSSYDLLDRRARTTFDPAYIKPFVYRAFDSRWLYYSPRLTSRAAWDIMAHMLAAENLALCTSRQVLEEFRHAFVARGLTNINVIDTAGKFGSGPAFPLYVYGPPGGQTGAQREFLDPHPWPKSSNGRRPNLAPGVVEAISNRLGLDFVLDGAGDLRKSFGPEDVFHYIYAFLHSRGYRERYAEFLRIDFPRIPLTSCLGLFRRLAHLGADLVALHLLDDAYPLASWARAGRPSPLATPIASYPVPGDNTVETSYPRYFEPGQPDPVSHKPLGQHRIYLNKDHPQTGKRAQFFECIPREVWEFRIGGYQVCERWLKDRQHRQLTYEDLTHYQRVLVAVQETLRRIAEIEDAIQQHGGWPIR
jgi:predicted helicase